MTHGWVAAAAGLFLAAGTALASPSADSTRTVADSASAAVDTTRAAAAVDTTRTVVETPKAAPNSAWIAVSTKPAGLRVRIGEAEAGRSPVDPFQVAVGRVAVRAYPKDPRRFEQIDGERVVEAAPGETIRVEFDLRPHPVVQSVPISAVSCVFWNENRADSLLGSTPIRLPPALLESNSIRLSATGYADSVVLGSRLLAQTGGGVRMANIVLRAVPLPPAAPPPTPSFYKRKWFAWTMVGVGALMTGGAVALRNEADRSYERYLDATDPRVIDDEYDRTIRYDRYAAGALGGGQVLFVTGIFLLISGTAK